MWNSSANRKLIAAGTIGNILEWYDFAIYGYFATQIGRQFFPKEDPVAQMLATFGIFAVGYIMRPVGGVIVGHIGDKFGQRAALTFSIVAMAVPTVLIGFLPGYETVGYFAPILLTALRMMQGLSVGGEYASSMIFMIEQAPAGRRGLMGGLAGASATLGTLLGSAIGAAFASVVPAEALESWGWRIPFLAGALVGVFGYLLRRHVGQTQEPVETASMPIVETIRFHWGTVLQFVGICIFHAGSFYIALVYLVSWVQTFNHVPASTALTINTISMGITVICSCISGHLSDKIGRKTLMVVTSAACALSALPLFWFMRGAMFWYGTPHFELGQIIFAVLLGLYYGSLPALLVELAPPSVKCTAVALGYNLAYGLLGGLSPLIATWLVSGTGYAAAPSIWIIICALVTLLTLTTVKSPGR